MVAALTGFCVIGAGILVGYLVGRSRVLGDDGSAIVGRLAFFVLTPFLLFVVLAEAEVDELFSSLLAVSALTAAIVIALFAIIARFIWKRPVAEVVIGSLSAGQVNANQIGIPLSLYLLGSAAFPAPVVLFQLVLLTPLSVTILEAATSGGRSAGRAVVRALTNPIVIGAVAGTVVSLTGITLPSIVMEPARLVANAAVPVLLIGYGMSLTGQVVLGMRGRRRDVLLASTMKLVLMPAVAYLLATLVFDLERPDVLAVVMLAALPTAQNVFNFAQRYRAGETIARETVLITTIGCVPALLAVTALLSG